MAPFAFLVLLAIPARCRQYQMGPAIHYEHENQWEDFKRRHDEEVRRDQERTERVNAQWAALPDYARPAPPPGPAATPNPPRNRSPLIEDSEQEDRREFKDVFVGVVQTFVRDMSRDGAFPITDQRTGEALRLSLQQVHGNAILRLSPIDAQGRADFLTVDAPKREVELDFHLVKDRAWKVSKIYVEAVNGRARFAEGASGNHERTAEPAEKPPRPAAPANLSAQIAVGTPSSDGRLTAGQTGTLKVSVTNSGPGPAYDVKLVVDPREAAGVRLPSEIAIGDLKPGETASAEAPLAADMKLKRGKIQFIGMVVEGNGFDTEPALIEVPTNASVLDVDAPPVAATPRNAKAFAVVVGIEKYRDVRASDYSARDAQAVRDYLVSAMGFSPENVTLLQNERAGLGDLATYLGPWLVDRAVSPDSRVFVYFAGHGTSDGKTGEGFLVPYDGDPAYPETKAFSLGRLYAALGALPAADVMVVLDACFSGAGGRSVAVVGARPLVHVKASRIGRNTVVLAAASGDQISASMPGARHGLMTYYLLRGLRGEADADGDGKVTTKELFDYLAPRVESGARGRHIEQRPTLEPSAEALGEKAKRVWIDDR